MREPLPGELTAAGCGLALVIPLCWSNVYWPKWAWVAVALSFPIAILAEIAAVLVIILAAIRIAMRQRPRALDLLWISTLLGEAFLLVRFS